MALENPITSDDLTIDFASLLDLSVSDRVQAAASDTGFAQALMASLTPIQMAKAFPDYYRKELPDISNFILANRYLDSGGQFDQRGGGDYGDDKPFYDGETAIPAGQNPTGVPEPSIEEMQAKLLEKGIDVNKTYDAIANGLSADDPQVQFLKNMSADKLAAMGIEQFKSDDGTVMYRKAPELSDQEVSNKISGKFVAKENASEKQKAVIEFASRWNISPQAAAGVLKIESGVTSDIAGGASGNYHGVFQLQTEQIRGLTEKAGFGSLTPTQYRKLSVADQLKVMDEYYKQAGVTPEFFTGDPQTDASKMWALQLAPGNAKKIDYNNPNAVISNTDQASTIEARNKVVTVGSAGSGSIAGGEQFLGDSFTRIEGTASPEQIAEFRNQQQKIQKEAFIREKFHQAAPTSLEYVNDSKNQTIINEHGYSVPVTGTMMHEGHGQTSEFGYGRGRLHAGVDIYSTDPETGQLRVGSNAPVIAPMDAKVTMIMKDRGAAGNYIEIQDKNGNRHRFLHTDESPALNPTTGEPWKVGESVTQGQTITNITGSGTKFDQKVKELGGDINAAVNYFDQNGWGSVNKPHLHYEVRDSRGKLLDPSAIFPEYSGENKENITFSNRNDKLKHLLVTGQITKDDYDKQMQNDPEVIAKQKDTIDTNLENVPENKKPLSIIEYSRPTEENKKVAETLTPESTPPQSILAAVETPKPEEAPKFRTDTSRKVVEPTATVTPAPATPVASADQTKPVAAPASPVTTAEPAPAAPVATPEPAPAAPVATPEPAPAAPVATPEPAKPVETASATPVGPAGGPEEVRKFRTGGSPDVQDDENLSVFDEDGSLKWKMNSGEGIYVKPKDTEYADDKMDELSGRIDELDDKMGSPPPEQNRPKTAPDKASARPDKNWQQNASSVTYSIGSQGRAFKRTKFQNEGFHFNRSAPNSTSS